MAGGHFDPIIATLDPLAFDKRTPWRVDLAKTKVTTMIVQANPVVFGRELVDHSNQAQTVAYSINLENI